MNLRNSVFWLIDKLKGSPVRQNFNEVAFMLENPNALDVIQRRKQYLEKIISHAVHTVPYYKGYEDTISLESLPIVNKNIIRDNMELFISNKYTLDQLFRDSTSGSTGTPFIFYKNKGKLIRNTADTMYHYNNDGYEVGKKLYYLRVWTEKNKKSKIAAFAQNMVMEDTSNLSKRCIEDFKAKLLRTHCDKYFLGYASSFEAIYLNSVGEDLSAARVKSIYSSSEVLTDQVRMNLAKLFNCAVYSRYSNMENGMLAQQYCMDTNEFRINTSSYVIEILNFDNDEHVKDGQQGRIVVTDLFNYGMPMLRYDTGDIGIYKEKSDILGVPVILSVEGRSKDCIYNTKGEKLTGIVVCNVMAGFTDILQYQFIQLAENEYLMKLNADKSEQREMKIRKSLQKFLLEDANIKFEYVSGIPLLSSGKRQYVVNKCEKYNKQ